MTMGHELHRRRRKDFESFFSRHGVTRIEDIVVDEVKILTDRFEALSKSGSIVQMEHVLAAFTGDIVIRICSERSPNMMRHTEFGKEWYASR